MNPICAEDFVTWPWIKARINTSQRNGISWGFLKPYISFSYWPCLCPWKETRVGPRVSPRHSNGRRKLVRLSRQQRSVYFKVCMSAPKMQATISRLQTIASQLRRSVSKKFVVVFWNNGFNRVSKKFCVMYQKASVHIKTAQICIETTRIRHQAID